MLAWNKVVTSWIPEKRKHLALRMPSAPLATLIRQVKRRPTMERPPPKERRRRPRINDYKASSDGYPGLLLRVYLNALLEVYVA